MKKVYQKRVDKGDGDCMQATIASLFEVELEEVPDFIRCGNQWSIKIEEFFKEKGYATAKSFHRTDWTIPFYLEALEYDGGIGGYFYAVVLSQTFKEEGVTHAVVVDKELNIVHDPNPNGLALKLKAEDILYVYVVKDNWYCDYENKKMIIE